MKAKCRTMQGKWHEMNRSSGGIRCVESRAMTLVWSWYIPMPRALISATNPITWRYRQAGIANRCDVSAAPQRS